MPRVSWFVCFDVADVGGNPYGISPSNPEMGKFCGNGNAGWVAILVAVVVAEVH
jgi:hypothetical protein